MNQKLLPHIVLASVALVISIGVYSARGTVALRQVEQTRADSGNALGTIESVRFTNTGSSLTATVSGWACDPDGGVAEVGMGAAINGSGAPASYTTVYPNIVRTDLSAQCRGASTLAGFVVTVPVANANVNVTNNVRVYGYIKDAGSQFYMPPFQNEGIYSYVEAEKYASTSGVNIGGYSGVQKAGSYITRFDQGDTVTYSNVEFNGSPSTLVFNVAARSNPGYIDIYLDSAQGQKLGTLYPPITGNSTNTNFTTKAVDIGTVSGTHSLVLVAGGAYGVAELDWLQVQPKPVALGYASPTPPPSTPRPTATPGATVPPTIRPSVSPGGTLPPYASPTPGAIQHWESELFNATGGVENVGGVVGVVNAGTYITRFDQGDWVAYNNVDLKNAGYLAVRLASRESPGAIDIRLDDKNGQTIGTFDPDQTGVGTNTNFTTQTVKITQVYGTHTLYFVAKGAYGVAELDWFETR